MGGSTVHGCYLDDLSTISARLQELLSSTRYKRKPVRVFNFSANNWILENMFNFFRTLNLQGFVPNKVITLYGVNDCKNMSWSCDISIYLDNLYKKSFERDHTDTYPYFDFPYFEDKSQDQHNFTSFDQHWLRSNLNKEPNLMKRFCAHVEAINRSFQKFCFSLNIEYQSWLQPVPSYLSEKLFSQVFCKQSLDLNRYAIIRIIDFYHLTSILYPYRLFVANQLSDKLKFLDFCHYSETACSKISQSLLAASVFRTSAHNVISQVKNLLLPNNTLNTSHVMSSTTVQAPTKFSSDTNYPLY
jgi:hypothetical protein